MVDALVTIKQFGYRLLDPPPVAGTGLAGPDA